jgi:hypothetical protein
VAAETAVGVILDGVADTVDAYLVANPPTATAAATTFTPGDVIDADNVQDAIEQAAALGGGGTPEAGSVTNTEVSASAGIVLSKTADSTGGAGRLAMTNAERSKLTGVETGALGPTSVDTAIADYLEANPIEAGELTGTLPIARYAADSVLRSTSAVARPTARTDVMVIFDTAADPDAVMLAGDIWMRRP